MAWQRLCAPGSDLSGSAWIKTIEAPGCEDLAWQHFQRTAAFLAEVQVGENRYVVCRHPLEAKKDAAIREAIVDKLRRTIEKQGPKAVVGNRG